MHVNTPSAWPKDEGDFAVRTNPGGPGGHFARIDLDGNEQLTLDLHSVEECDRLIKAACEAKRMLEAVTSGVRHQHEAPEGDAWLGSCAACGAIKNSDIHKVPEPEPEPARELCGAVEIDEGGDIGRAPGIRRVCELPKGHEGRHTEFGGADRLPVYWWPQDDEPQEEPRGIPADEVIAYLNGPGAAEVYATHKGSREPLAVPSDAEILAYLDEEDL